MNQPPMATPPLQGMIPETDGRWEVILSAGIQLHRNQLPRKSGLEGQALVLVDVFLEVSNWQRYGKELWGSCPLAPSHTNVLPLFFRFDIQPRNHPGTHWETCCPPPNWLSLDDINWNINLFFNASSEHVREREFQMFQEERMGQTWEPPRLHLQKGCNISSFCDSLTQPPAAECNKCIGSGSGLANPFGNCPDPASGTLYSYCAKQIQAATLRPENSFIETSCQAWADLRASFLFFLMSVAGLKLIMTWKNAYEAPPALPPTDWGYGISTNKKHNLQ